MNQKDRERCEKDFLKCLGKVALKLIYDEDNPYTLSEHEIESNGTVRKKTLRLLSEAGKIYWSGYTGRRYISSAESFNFKRHFENVARSYERKPEFPSVPAEISTAWRNTGSFGTIDTTQENINEIGYLRIDHFNPEEQIYIWFHLDEFVISKKSEITYYTGENTTIRIYPRQQLDQRKVQAMRGIFKKYAEPLLMPWLSEKFGLNLQGFDTFTSHSVEINSYNYLASSQPKIPLRSCMRFPAAFNDLAFKGPKGYAREYNTRLYWIQKKTEIMSFLVKSVKDYGYEKLMKEFVEHAKEYLLSDAPLKLIDDDEAGAGHMILSNIDLITFENMFGGNDEYEGQSQAA
jgi:hypothetical protein